MIPVLHLFPKLNSSLIELLEGLTPAQWDSQTLCREWCVKDIAAHLLDTAMRRVSSGRDNHFAKVSELSSYEELLNYLNSLNASWVDAYKRVSARILVKQLSVAQDDFYEHLLTLDLNAPATFPVSWAGEKQSQTWFDIAREYTERWHHQQQIRLAVGSKPLLEPELYRPFLEVSMLALPYHFRHIEASDEAMLQVNIVGDAGGSWSIVRDKATWKFTESETADVTQVYIDQNIAWMLFSRGIDISEAQQYWQVSGDYELGTHALKMTAFMI